MTHPLLEARYTVFLADGREIELKTLSQQLTYLNLICGDPIRSMNRELTQSHLLLAEEKQHRLSLALKPVLIEPTVTSWQCSNREENEDPLNPHEALPAVLSIAVFDSSALGTREACSSALVVWYQNQWGLPTLPILEELRKLDWDQHARDWTW